MDLYYSAYSPPCQSVLLLVKDLGVKVNKKVVNMAKGEYLSQEYIKINPQHTIPTLNDNGFCLWESRAILGYLVDKYAKDDSLYPKDAAKRALINQRLYFDIGTLFQKFVDLFRPMFMGGADPKPEQIASTFEEPLKLMDVFLQGHDWVCGNTITIADYSLMASVSCIELFGYDMSKHPNTEKWLSNARNKMAGYDEVIPVGHAAMKRMLANRK